VYKRGGESVRTAFALCRHQGKETYESYGSR